jgi:PleD family two-component response regulator
LALFLQAYPGRSPLTKEVDGHNRRGTMAQKILVVDDEPAVRGFLNEFFTEEGYKVLQASTASRPYSWLK